MTSPVLSESNQSAFGSKLKQTVPAHLEFVTFSNPNQLKSRKTQQTIRRHAGYSGALKSQKNRRSPAVVFELDPIDPKDKQNVEESDSTTGKVISDAISKQVISSNELRSLFRPLSVGFGLNPLQNFPIKYDARISQLVEFLLHSSKKNYQPLFEIWIYIALSDVSGFHLLLSNAATIIKEDSAEESLESVKHYTMSLKSVATRMNDPKARTSEGLMGAVLGFACQDVCSSKNRPKS
jgi:hypothetical protein